VGLAEFITTSVEERRRLVVCRNGKQHNRGEASGSSSFLVSLVLLFAAVVVSLVASLDFKEKNGLRRGAFCFALRITERDCGSTNKLEESVVTAKQARFVARRAVHPLFVFLVFVCFHGRAAATARSGFGSAARPLISSSWTWFAFFRRVAVRSSKRSKTL